MIARHPFPGWLLLLGLLLPISWTGRSLHAHGPAPLGGSCAAGPLQSRPGCALAEVRPCPEDPPVPIVTLKVRVAAQGQLGRDLEYRICVENCSPAAAHHVVVRNPLPANARFVKAQPEPTKKEPELQWHLGTLQGGERRIILLTLSPTNKEDVTNCARVQFEHGQCVTTRLSEGPPPSQAGLTLHMSGPKQQYLNLPARYFFTVTNPGSEKASNVLLTASLPEKSDFVRASDDGKHLAGQVAWLLGSIGPGETRVVDLSLRARENGELCVKGKALADGGLSAQAESCTFFMGASALALEVTDRRDPLLVDGETSYPIVVRNQGSLPVTNIRIKAIIPDGLTLTRALGPADHKSGGNVPGGQVLLFDALPSLEPGNEAAYEIFVKGMRSGDMRFRMELTADQLQEGGPVREEESTTIYAD